MYKILMELRSSYYCHKNLATGRRGEAKICSPESKRGAGLSSQMLALGTEPSPCVQPLCMLSLAWEGCYSLSPHKQRCKSFYINERGRWKLFTEEGSLLRVTFHCFNCLRKSLFVIVSCQQEVSVQVGVCMHRIYVYEEKELSLWSVSLKHMASIFP